MTTQSYVNTYPVENTVYANDQQYYFGYPQYSTHHSHHHNHCGCEPQCAPPCPPPCPPPKMIETEKDFDCPPVRREIIRTTTPPPPCPPPKVVEVEREIVQPYVRREIVRTTTPPCPQPCPCPIQERFVIEPPCQPMRCHECPPRVVCCEQPRPVCCPQPQPVCCPQPRPVCCPQPQPVCCPQPRPVCCPQPQPVCCPQPRPTCRPSCGPVCPCDGQPSGRYSDGEGCYNGRRYHENNCHVERRPDCCCPQDPCAGRHHRSSGGCSMM